VPLPTPKLHAFVWIQQVQKKLHKLNEQLHKLTESLATKQQALTDYNNTISETEAAYSKIVCTVK
jgi:hypothetical protein